MQKGSFGKMTEDVMMELQHARCKDGYSGVPLVQDFASLYAQEEARMRRYFVSCQTELAGSSANKPELNAQPASSHHCLQRCADEVRCSQRVTRAGQVHQTQTDKDRRTQSEIEREKT